MINPFEGVRPASESSIEIEFRYRNVICRERIRLKPSGSNLKRASIQRAAVLTAIEQGIFDYAETFPHSKNAALFAESTLEGTVDQ